MQKLLLPVIVITMPLDSATTDLHGDEDHGNSAELASMIAQSFRNLAEFSLHSERRLRQKKKYIYNFHTGSKKV